MKTNYEEIYIQAIDFRLFTILMVKAIIFVIYI